MRTGYTIVLVCLISSASLLMTGCGEDSPSGPPAATKATPPTVPPGYSSRPSMSSFMKAPMWSNPWKFPAWPSRRSGEPCQVVQFAGGEAE